MADSRDPGYEDELQVEVVGSLSDRAIEAWAELLISAELARDEEKDRKLRDAEPW